MTTDRTLRRREVPDTTLRDALGEMTRAVSTAEAMVRDANDIVVAIVDNEDIEVIRAMARHWDRRWRCEDGRAIV